MSAVQIREADTPGVATTLVVHATRPDGSPICGQPVRPWRGRTMALVRVDAAPTCLRCAKGTP